MTDKISGLPEKLTRVYIKIRDAKAKMKAEFDKKYKELDEQQDKVKGALLTYCKEQDVESVRTESGLFYRSVKTRYWASDWEAVNEFVIANKMPEMYEKRINQSVVKQWLEENPDDALDFINLKSEYQISVRKT